MPIIDTTATKSITLIRLEPDDALALLNKFRDTVGHGHAIMTHGKNFPKPVLGGDVVYRAELNTGEAGWARLTPATDELAVWLTYGVFPRFESASLWCAIRAVAAREAFNSYDGGFSVSMVRVAILHTNVEHKARCLLEAECGSQWRISGEVTHPWPGYAIFTLTREDWELNGGGTIGGKLRLRKSGD